MKKWLSERSGRVAGVSSAFLFAIVYLICGFWDMLFCALLLGGGYWIGKLKDEHQSPLFPWDKIMDWLNAHWPKSR